MIESRDQLKARAIALDDSFGDSASCPAVFDMFADPQR